MLRRYRKSSRCALTLTRIHKLVHLVNCNPQVLVEHNQQRRSLSLGGSVSVNTKLKLLFNTSSQVPEFKLKTSKQMVGVSLWQELAITHTYQLSSVHGS